MRIIVRALFHATLMVALAGGILVPNASAGSLITTTFGGSVKALPGYNFPNYVAAKDIILDPNSSFSYGTPSSGTGASGVYTFANSGSAGFALNVATPGQPTTLWSDTYAGSPATFTISMAVSGTTTTLTILADTLGGSQSGGKVNPSVTLVLTSTTYTGSGVFGRKALPTGGTGSASLSAFLTTTGNLTWDPGGVGDQQALGFGGTINSFDGTATVPEPSSAVLLGVAAATCGMGFAVSRRKRARAS